MAQKSILSFFKTGVSSEEPATTVDTKIKESEGQEKKEVCPSSETSLVKEDPKNSPLKETANPVNVEENIVVVNTSEDAAGSIDANTNSEIKPPEEMPIIIIPRRKTARKQTRCRTVASRLRLQAFYHELNARNEVVSTVDRSQQLTKQSNGISNCNGDSSSAGSEKIDYDDEGSDVDVEEKPGTPVKRGKNASVGNESSLDGKRKLAVMQNHGSSEESEPVAESPVKKPKISSRKSRSKVLSSSDDSDDKEDGDVNEEASGDNEEAGDDNEEAGDDNEDDGASNETETADMEEDAADKKVVKPAIHSFFAPQRKEKAKNTSPSKSEAPKESSNTSDSKSTELYNPSKSKYHPIEDACWKKGEKVPYLALSRTLEEIEKTSGRLRMIEILANFFRSVIAVTPDDLLPSVYLCLNRLGPEYEGIEMGVGETLLMKAVAQATGRTVDKIKAEVTVKGDLGLVAESSRGNQRVMFAFPKLTVSSVFAKFKEIAQMSGNSVMSKKVDKMQALFAACRYCEAKYIVRSLRGKLRIGLAEQSLLAALAQAVVLTPPNQSEIMNASSGVSADSFKEKLDAQALILKSTYCECPNYDMVIPVLLKEGISALPKHCHLTPGIPLKPMLAHPTSSTEEVLKRFDGNEFTCEFKYDGERAQIHRDEKGTIKIYSRNQEDNTSKYPDVISRLPRALKEDTVSFILDSEAVAWDREANQILPFQVLSTRKKKDAVDSEIKVQVCIVAFDLLYLNGESLIKKPLKERRELLKKAFVEVPKELMFANSTDGNSADVMQEFLEVSIKGCCEGLMVKSLEVDATYEIAKRSHNWLKLKKDYLAGAGDTLDLVVIGGWYGKGKRTGNYGGFLLACYDNETEEFQTICKIGTGFKDEDLEAHTKFLKEHVISSAKSYYRFSSGQEPDVWFDSVQVWEVKCADLSISPVHKAATGLVDPEKGISLRFPRFLKVRDDKKVEDATTSSQVARMYNSQEQVQNQAKKDLKKDEDY